LLSFFPGRVAHFKVLGLSIIFARMTDVSFVLYICSQSPISIQAEANLNTMCLTHFPGHHQVEIVDLLQDPQRGLLDGIIVSPTLVRTSPEPKQIVMGNLSDLSRVLRAVSWSSKPENQRDNSP
jgi:circadian clock protein KaiB